MDAPEPLGSAPPRLFAIRNAQLASSWEPDGRTLRSVAGRSVSALIRSQGLGDLYRIFRGSQRDSGLQLCVHSRQLRSRTD